MKKSVYIFAALLIIALTAFRQPPLPQPRLLTDYSVIDDAPNVPIPTVQPQPTGPQCPPNHIAMPLPNPPCVPISRPTPPGGIGLP